METRTRISVAARAPVSPDGGKHRIRYPRETMAAGRVLVAALVCLTVWTLLDADALKRSSDASKPGARRTAALAVLRPAAFLSRVTLLDALGDTIERALGRDPDSRSGIVSGQLIHIGAPTGPTPSGPAPSPHPTPHPTKKPHPKPSHRGTHGGHPQQNPSNPTPAPSRPSSSLPPLPRPTASDPLRILVIGDSFAGDIGYGFARNMDTHVVSLTLDGIQSTGLSNSDYFDWQVRVRQDVAKLDPQLVVVLIGGNDFGRAVRLPSGDVQFTDVAAWKRAYGLRVRQLVQGATARGARVLWVGLPIVANASLAKSYERINAEQERVAARDPRVLYLPTWNLFADKNGNYSSYLPDPNGDLVQMRTSDNIHLTNAGNDRLARYALKVMRRVWHLSRNAMSF
jgi:hypothetical protein